MFGVWDVRDVGCLGCRMWDVRCLLGCGMLIYKMPNKSGSSFSPSWLVIRECVILSWTCDNVRSVFWNFFTRKGFPATNQTASVNQFSTINGSLLMGGQYFLDLLLLFFGGALEKLLFLVEKTGEIRVKRGTHYYLIFWSTLEIILKGGNGYKRSKFQFCIIAFVP